MTPMPTAAADWIRDTVLTVSYRKSTADPTLCHCQGGVCHYCQLGKHTGCTVVRWGGAPRVHPETRIVGRHGYVATAPGVSTSDVWVGTRACRWVCACGCTPVGAEPPPVNGHAPIQLDLLSPTAFFTSASRRI